MFTGIVEELGKIEDVRFKGESGNLQINSTEIISDINIGDSVSVNGVCLTVVEILDKSFTVDVMRETLLRSNLHDLKKNSRVNLERAVRLNDRLGGHLVSGHIDSVGVICSTQIFEIAKLFTIQLDKELIKYIIEKGSIAVDGISLTVVETRSDSFTVSIIPHTMKTTTLAHKKEGDKVNLEVDLIAKYVEKLVHPPEDKGISYSFLAEKGFLGE